MLLLAATNKILEPRFAQGEFDVYAKRFELLSILYERPVDARHVFFVTFQSTGDVVGECFPVLPIPAVAINRNYWRSATRWDREALIFHELGHCLLYREHRDSLKLDIDRCPKSLMHSDANFDTCFPKYREEYISELFTYDEKGAKFSPWKTIKN